MIVFGGAFLVIGAALFLLEKLGVGHLPGDIVIRRESFTLIIPVASSLLFSILLTTILWFLRK